MTAPKSNARYLDSPKAPRDPKSHAALRRALAVWADRKGYTEPAFGGAATDVALKMPDGRGTLAGEAVPREFPHDPFFRDRLDQLFATAEPKSFAAGTLCVAVAFGKAADAGDWADVLQQVTAKHTDAEAPVVSREKLSGGAMVVFVRVP